MQSKITAIEPRGAWDGKYGKMYAFKVCFEDGQDLEVNSKTEQPPYQVGDVMEYTITGSDPKYGAKGKVSKPDSNNWATNDNGRTNRDKDIMRQTALKAAVEFNAQRSTEVSRVLVEAEMMYQWLLGEHDLLNRKNESDGQ